MKKETKIMFVNMISIILVIVITMLTILIYSPLHLDGVENDLEIIEPVATTEAVITTNVTTTTTAITTTVTTTITTITTTTVVTTTTKEETTTTVVTECDNENTATNTYLFYRESMRVHRSDCIYADSSCMEIIEGDYIDEARPCLTCNPDITIGTLYEPQEYIEEEVSYDYSESSCDGMTRLWDITEMTYFTGEYGYSGRKLEDNLSVACNIVPQGSILYIKSPYYGVEGYYRVDDIGYLGNNTIDIYYSDYSLTPSLFRRDGRVYCEVYLVE